MAVATGDYNGDGREDIVWRHQGSGQNVLWYMGDVFGTTLQSGEFTDPPVFADTQLEDRRPALMRLRHPRAPKSWRRG